MLVLMPGQTLNLDVVPPTSVVPVNDFPFVASYVDVDAPATYEPGNAHGVVDEAGASAVAAPTAGARQVKFLSVYNADAGPHAVRVFLDEGADERTIVQVNLEAGSSLVYTDGAGFRVITSDGEIVQTSTP